MITPNDFLVQSKDLLNLYGAKENNETYLRSAVSRAYYALFHEAKKQLEAKHKREFDEAYAKLTGQGKSTKSTAGVSMHRVVRDALRNIKNGNAAFISQKFYGYKDLRNTADYELNENFGYDDVAAKVDGMQNLIAQIKNI